MAGGYKLVSPRSRLTRIHNDPLLDLAQFRPILFNKYRLSPWPTKQAPAPVHTSAHPSMGMVAFKFKIKLLRLWLQLEVAVSKLASLSQDEPE